MSPRSAAPLLLRVVATAHLAFALFADPVVAGGPPAPAGDGATDAEARAAFAEGLKQLDGRNWQGAADAFTRTLALRASPEVRFNLATAFVELARLREALFQLDAILRETNVRKRVRQSAELMKQQILPRLGHVIIEAQDDEILNVSLDGHLCEAQAWRSGIPAEPGAHRVAIARVEGPPVHREVAVKAGETVRLTLVPQIQLTRPVLAAQAEASAYAAQTPAKARAAGSHRWLWWTAGAALAGLVVVAAQRGSGGDPVTGNAGHFEIGAR